MTRYEKITSMGIGEFAEFLISSGFGECSKCPIRNDCEKEKLCEWNIKDWLGKEIQGVDNLYAILRYTRTSQRLAKRMKDEAEKDFDKAYYKGLIDAFGLVEEDISRLLYGDAEV